jgi:hypothetical protein
MKVTDEDLRRALLRAGSPTERSRCPSSEALARAAAAAPEGAGEAIVEHLAQCAECTQEFLLAASLKPWAEEAAAQLAPSVAPAAAVPHRSRPLVVGLAAALAAAFMGVGGWSLWLRQQNVEIAGQLAETQKQLRSQAMAAARPVAGVRLVDLFPRDPARGAGTAATELRVPPSVRLVVLILNVRQAGDLSDSADLVRDPDSRRIWEGPLMRGAEPLTLAVPSDLLPEGRYTVRLHRKRSGGIESVEEYAFTVAPPGGAEKP